MRNVGELAIVGLSPELLDAIVDELIKAFRTGYAPTRASLLSHLKADHPQVVHRRVEYTLAQVLYKLENKGNLKRTGNHYFPTKQLVIPAGGK